MNRKPLHLAAFISVFSLVILSCSAAGNLPNPFASPTPTATATFTPSPTPSPTPTLTPSPTPVPEAVVEKLSTGATEYTDYEGGYRLTFPRDWLVINLAVDDPEKAVKQARQANPAKAGYLSNLDFIISHKGRMASFDFAPDQYSATSAPAAFAILDRTSSFMSLQAILDQNAKTIPQLLKAKVKASKVAQNPSGVSYGVIDVSITLTADGATSTVYEKLVIFKTPDYTVMITLAALDDLQASALPGFSAIIDSIELLK
jgi:hypothetical protein